MITVIELHPKVQEFMDWHGDVGYACGVKYYSFNRMYFVSSDQPNIFTVQKQI